MLSTTVVRNHNSIYGHGHKTDYDMSVLQKIIAYCVENDYIPAQGFCEGQMGVLHRARYAQISVVG